MDRFLSGDGRRLSETYRDVTFGHDVQIIGLRNTAIGPGSCIGDGTWLNVCQRDGQVRLTIGKRVLVGRHSMISTGGRLEIGDFNLFAPRVYISDADHVFTSIDSPYAEQGATLNRSVVVEENCWIGINAVIAGDLTVGRGSVVAANSVVLRSIPPFSVMVGSPARIVKLYNPETRAWEAASTEQDQVRILEARLRHPVPDREEYREILNRNSRVGRVDPIVAGRGECI